MPSRGRRGTSDLDDKLMFTLFTEVINQERKWVLFSQTSIVEVVRSRLSDFELAFLPEVTGKSF